MAKNDKWWHIQKVNEHMATKKKKQFFQWILNNIEWCSQFAKWIIWVAKHICTV